MALRSSGGMSKVLCTRRCGRGPGGPALGGELVKGAATGVHLEKAYPVHPTASFLWLHEAMSFFGAVIT